MAEIKLFQICHEGDLTIDLVRAIRRLGAEPSFDQSWHVWLTEERHAAPIVRWLRKSVAYDSRLLVACTQFTSARDFLLIRHSLTAGADYRELHGAIARLGSIIDLPFESTFVVQSDDRTDLNTLGAALGELCPDDSLMVVGVSHDWAFCNAGVSRMNLPTWGQVCDSRFST
ncbi:MAG TPA: hypothetical protein VJ853_09090, partial [Thermoanaerobaculia bacterium]|nr:hypothetical protein [Thermoanaerobaculia bacterium]